MEFDTSAGKAEVKNVIGTRCPGIRYAGESVRNVASKVRGSWEDGVRINLVLAASIGASSSAAMAVAAVDINTVAAGDAEDKMDALGITPEDP